MHPSDIACVAQFDALQTLNFWNINIVSYLYWKNSNEPTSWIPVFWIIYKRVNRSFETFLKLWILGMLA